MFGKVLRSGVVAAACCTPAIAQQLPERDYRPPIVSPAYAAGRGPSVCVDEAHHNFHTLDGRYWSFGELLRRDGYAVRPLRGAFTRASLAPCAIVVIANAQPSAAEWDDYPYPTPSAFGAAEIRATRRWVREGGSLWLIADHMPLAGAAARLAAAFGVKFNDGFAMPGFDADPARRAQIFQQPGLFRVDAGSLTRHAAVRGRDESESVAQVRSFTGQAFQAPAEAEPLLILPQGYVSLMPKKAWRFDADTARVPVAGWLQGAVMRVGKGRAAFFGEAAMFTTQVQGAERRPMGMNASGAERNYQFTLNLAHWLSGLLDPATHSSKPPR
ncbi:hypothetical protein GLA29479_1229 [Lysobacter antibioticus]|uniref:hypothetical protein n=1 Tax=Lysobacter antibioticus TaxID=84531 RepID=UPI000716FAFC|nr:hypothetical protein [Lysobacter antibioticus]ALN62113.1 hypothetical protein GLA29479_1229 [Lysobacter antibioticus]